MAPRIKAVNAYRPRIEQGNTVQKPELLRAVSRATSLVEGSVDLAIKESRDQIIEFCRTGRAVKVESLGIFAPSIDLAGNLTISFQPDPAFANGLNMPGTFSGTILNREFIGKTSAELVERWNAEHAEDPVVFSEN
jgi:HU domain fused to wHTH, Ig, or Glycine-rich motif